MKDEALRMALEALENSVDLVREDAYNAEKLYGNYPSRQGKVGGLKVLADDHEKAITAIRQALAAPVPMAHIVGEIDHAGKVWTPAQPAPVQEPYSAPVKEMWPAVPDAIGPHEDELPAYAAGWNDCRAEMLKGMKP
jgi:hypothetical protein